MCAPYLGGYVLAWLSVYFSDANGFILYSFVLLAVYIQSAYYNNKYHYSQIYRWSNILFKKN